MNISERIVLFREALGYSQDKLGENLGVTRSSVCNWESGRRNISESIIKAICLKSWNGKFVNEFWLRDGKGNMFQELPPEDETAAVISNVLEDVGCENSIYNLVKEALLKYERLDSNSKKVVENYIDDVLSGMIEKREEK